MRRHVRRLGATVLLQTTRGAWHVPVHYLALHGYRPWAFSDLAAFYGWEPVAGIGSRHGNGGSMVEHRVKVTTEPVDDQHVRVAFECDVCEGGSYIVPQAHVKTLAVGLLAILKTVGVDIAKEVENTPVIETTDERKTANGSRRRGGRHP